MNTINACFVSYRHTGDAEADKFVRAFVAQLKMQLTLYMPSVPVFFDEHGLKVGDQYNEELAYQLCRSACMVLVFSPLYFDINHPYCAFEYKAVLELERRRLGQAMDDLRNKSLIFPVVFRGLDCLPEEIKGKRNYENFDHVIAESDFQRRKCRERLKVLAEEIWKCYRALYNASVFLQDDCRQFHFPERVTIEQWLQGVPNCKHIPCLATRNYE